MSEKQSHYAKAGVDIDAGQKTVDLMKEAVKATYTENVLSDTGNFGGLFAVDALKNMQSPVLVASTDGVGTKTKIATALDKWDTIGQDLVNHCINDILVQGARPLFFLDYVASSKLVPEQIAGIVTGMAKACQEAGCALLGGETAEMPGVYTEGEVDVVGTIVGVLDKPNLLDGSRIQAGDVIFGIPSTGLHTNGFSLARHALADLDLDEYYEEFGATLGETLLAVHRNYVHEIDALLANNVDIRGLAHITGGGMVDNIPRVLPDNVNAVIDYGSWDVLPIFDMIQQRGNIDTEEMLRVFNMGIGMVVIVPADDADLVAQTLGDAYRIGQITDGQGKVKFQDYISPATKPVREKKRPMRLVVMISGSGTNLQAIIDAIESNHLNARVVAVVSNRKDAFGLQRAEEVGIDCVYFPLKLYKDQGKSREEYDADLAATVAVYQPDLVVLAGWMHILSPTFLEQFPQKVINLHPALPGEFAGTNAIQRAFIAAREGKIKRSGIMVHYAIPEVDAGDVIIHAEVPILRKDTLDDFEKRMHLTEHKLIVKAIALLADKI